MIRDLFGTECKLAEPIYFMYPFLSKWTDMENFVDNK